MEFMDYVYDPQVARLIEDSTTPTSVPCPRRNRSIANQLKDPTVANSPTVFPDAQMKVARSKPYYQFKTSQDLDQWNSTFEPIYTG